MEDRYLETTSFTPIAAPSTNGEIVPYQATQQAIELIDAVLVQQPANAQQAQSWIQSSIQSGEMQSYEQVAIAVIEALKQSGFVVPMTTALNLAEIGKTAIERLSVCVINNNQTYNTDNSSLTYTDQSSIEYTSNPYTDNSVTNYDYSDRSVVHNHYYVDNSYVDNSYYDAGDYYHHNEESCGNGGGINLLFDFDWHHSSGSNSTSDRQSSGGGNINGMVYFFCGCMLFTLLACLVGARDWAYRGIEVNPVNQQITQPY